MRQTTHLVIVVEYDEDATDPDSLCDAFDRLLATAMSTPGILDEHGSVALVRGFEIEPDENWSPGDYAG